MGYVIQVLMAMWSILSQLAPNGVDPTNFWLAFILISALTYLLLSLIHLFNDKDGIRLLVSVIMGYFGAGSAFATVFLAAFFPNLTMGLFIILGLLMVLAMILPGKTYSGMVTFSLIVFFLVLLGTWQGVSSKLGIGGGIGGSGSSGVPGMTPDDWAALILIIVVIAIFILSVRKPKEDQKKIDWNKVMNSLFTKKIE